MSRAIEAPPSFPALVVLSTTTAVAILPHLTLLPIWFGLFLAFCIGWRLLAGAAIVRPPAAFLRLLLTFSIAAVVLFHYGTVLGQTGGTALLATMLSLKLLETWRYRDVFLASVLVYFLTLSAFLSSQSVWMLPYLFAVLVGSTTSLLLLRGQRFRKLSLKPMLFASKLIGFSLLPAILLLYLFPRLGSPLWGLPQMDDVKTGLSDEMSPGSFTDLINDDRPAMRVRFDGDAVPEPNQRYWRGPVMWDYDGLTWRGIEHRQLQRFETPLLEIDGEPIDYEVTLLNPDRPYRFFLEMPTSMPSDIVLLPDYQALARQPVNDNVTYRGQSASDYRLQLNALNQRTRQRALALPEQFNPQSLELAQRWQARFNNDLDLINHSLRYFREQSFSYTLTPPLLGRHAMDEFLFETRAGFCEHYASAFVVLMRAANIPARVVTGYQGGDYVDSSDYLLIRHSNAHAWAEVWLQGRGWIRVDPTAAVSPERIESGVMNTTAAPTGWQHAAWIRELRQNWDAVQDQWDRWLVSYDNEDQNALLDKMGLGRYGKQAMVVVLFVVLSLMLGTLGWWLLSKRRAHQDRLYEGYVKLSTTLAKAGLPCQASDSPAMLMERLQAIGPSQTEALKLLDEYQQLRYQPHASAVAIDNWLQRVRTLRTPKLSVARNTTKTSHHPGTRSEP